VPGANRAPPIEEGCRLPDERASLGVLNKAPVAIATVTSGAVTGVPQTAQAWLASGTSERQAGQVLNMCLIM
jgi:hypothetical protein